MRRGPRARLEIGGLIFTTKSSALALIRGIRDRHLASGESLGGDDLAFMLAVLGRHPNAVEKVGVGVRRMWVRRNSANPRDACFWIERQDGTQTDFSFLHCLTPRTARNDVIEAMRDAVKDQVASFKRDFFAENGAPVCPILGLTLDMNNSEVDHVYPLTFKQLADYWFADRNIDPETIAIDGHGDGEIVKTFADETIAPDWRGYHRDHARLRVISGAANRKLSSRSDRS